MSAGMESRIETSTRERAVTAALVLPGTTPTIVGEHVAELEKLIETAGGEVAGRMISSRRSPDAATFVGSGKADEIRDLVKEVGARLVVFNDDLFPAQTRNLEKITGVKVIDRSGLILDIFARGARSREARTQVELAQLQYMLPRLKRQWTHLERQAGGIGTRGVGETQLETDRRIIRERVARLREDLRHIERSRETQRKARRNIYSVALVGYTNAGKSTLFNRLTEGSAEEADKLFATLDSKVQKCVFSMHRETVFIDTVGFIRKLPHHLVASFRSTMEEAVSADLVLHVVDGSHVSAEEQRDVGNEVLADLGVPPEGVIEVFNKSDLAIHVMPSASGSGAAALAVSGSTGAGIEALLDVIRQRQLREGEVLRMRIPFSESRLIAKLHDLAEVIDQRNEEGAACVTAWIPRESLHLYERFVDTGHMEPTPAGDAER